MAKGFFMRVELILRDDFLRTECLKLQRCPHLWVLLYMGVESVNNTPNHDVIE